MDDETYRRFKSEMQKAGKNNACKHFAAEGKCFNPNDKKKILAVIGSDLEAFNVEVLQIVEKVRLERRLKEEAERRSAEQDRPKGPGWGLTERASLTQARHSVSMAVDED